MTKIISREKSERIANTAITHMRICAVLWLIVASFQIIFGIPLIVFFGYGITMISCGAWNIYASVRRLKNAKFLSKHKSSVLPYFKDSLNPILISITINVIFGGVIGVIAGVYDLLVRNYVINHEEDLKYREEINYA